MFFYINHFFLFKFFYMLSFQKIINKLQDFWIKNNCVLIQPLDMEVGAATFHHQTVFRALGKDPWRAVFVQPCRRPSDGRYAKNPNRLQHYYQMQVLIKPSPEDSQELYIKSLEKVGIDWDLNDIKFVEDDWESPTLGAAGFGWEVQCNGMEISQFTYFQQMGSIDCDPVSLELTYGLERLAMFIQNVDNIFDIIWDDSGTTYGDIFKTNEEQMCHYNFQYAPEKYLFDSFASS